MDAWRRLADLLRPHNPLRNWLYTHSFSVSLVLDELANVSCITSWLYCKIRLLDGSFAQESERREVICNSAHWGKAFVFEFQTTVDKSTGVLEDCMCRLSVRRDLKGGKSHKKVGYVDLNLSSFVGCGYITRHCLLEGYRGNNKLDNSILKIGIQVHLVQGDPCFQVTCQQSTISMLRTPSVQDYGVLRASASGYSDQGLSVDNLERQMGTKDGDIDASCSHSPEAQERAQVAEQLARVGHTRVNAQDVVDNLCSESFTSTTNLSHIPEDVGLALYVKQNGTTILGVSHRENRYSMKDLIKYEYVCGN